MGQVDKIVSIRTEVWVESARSAVVTLASLTVAVGGGYFGSLASVGES